MNSSTPIQDDRCKQELPAYLKNYSRKKK